jgi:hypothetical protein
MNVVDISNNDLLFVPHDFGRLRLKSINIEGNPKIRLPAAVTEGGTPTVMAYLQTLGEQHRLVDAHMEQFTFMVRN